MEQRTMAGLTVVRDRILDGAGDLAGAVVLDVGSGDGLVGFGALERAGASGRVIFADISEDLLNRARTIARAREVDDRCEFICTDAASLTGIPDASIDVVVLRSVLIYVDDKPAAFEAFGRVLRSGDAYRCSSPSTRSGAR